MAHQDTSICARAIALAEEGGLRAGTAGELHGVLKSPARAWLQKYRRDGHAGRLRGTGLWCVSSPAQDVVLVAEAQRNPFISVRDLKAATGFPGQKNILILKLKEAGLKAQHAAVKELLTDEHKLYHLAIAESNVDRKWESHIL
jgi:hypothetical protein